jgi:23S rRNA pseudouridine2605 synthase
MEENKDKDQPQADAVNTNGQEAQQPTGGAPTGNRPRMRHRIGRAEKVDTQMMSNQENYSRYQGSARPYRNSYENRTYDRTPRSYGDRSYGDRQHSERSWGSGYSRTESRYDNDYPQYSRRETMTNPNAERPQRPAQADRGFGPRQGYQRQDQYQHRPAGGSYQRSYQRPYSNHADSFNRVDADYHREGAYRQDSYQQRQPRYGSYDRQGGYPQREGFGGQRQGGFGGQRQGGYQQRPSAPYQRQRQGSYDPAAKYSQRKVLRYKEENIDPTKPMRLNKFLANAGLCSRREADKYIEAGLVTVNGQVVTELGSKVLRTDEVKFHDQPVKLEDKIYVLLNKPKDYVTTSDDPQNRKTVMDLVKNACPERIYPIGRLDRNTTGVLLLTNDGDMASKLMHPKFMKKKIYHVFLNKPVTEADMQHMLSGIELEDGEIKADAVEYASETDKKQVGIEIHSGKNRIVRRIFEHLGYRVVKLDRVYFAGLTKKNLRRGEWRFLTEDEVRILRMGAFE